MNKHLKALCGKFLLFACAFCAACGIQTFEDLADLHPPLVLSVTNVSPEREEFTLRFMSFNNEKNFSGFNVYIGGDTTEVNNKRKVINNPRTDGLPTFPANKTTFQDGPKWVELTITREHGNSPPLNEIPRNFFVGVAAYDAVYRESSKTSIPVNVNLNLNQGNP